MAELNEQVQLNETLLDQKRIRFRELELMEQDRIVKIEKLSEELNLQESKSDDLRKELQFLVDEIESKKSAAVELSDQLKNDEELHQEKSLQNKNLETDEKNKLIILDELNNEVKLKNRRQMQ